MAAPVQSPDHDAFGRAVRETRARRGHSQETLGLIAGVHRNYVGAIERGEINPTFRLILALVDGLDISVSELMKVYERQVGESSKVAARRRRRRRVAQDEKEQSDLRDDSSGGGDSA